MVCQRPFPHFSLRPAVSALASACLLPLALASLNVGAAENGLQRYSPGVGGSDMTAPLMPGSYFQAPLVAYHANKIKGNDGQQATAAVSSVPGLRASTEANVDAYALLPRFTHLSAKRLLGANVGFTVMLPVVNRRGQFNASPQFTGSFAQLPPLTKGLIAAGVQQAAQAQNGDETGLGDLEVSPLLHWEIGDHQAVTFAPTVVLPTSHYDVKRRVNTGYGNFYTFRPSVQYSFIGDGWDVGARAVFSFNTRNKDNGYYSGNMFNLDWQAMAFVSEDWRMGLQGYFVRQLSRDTQDLSGFSANEVKALRKEIIAGNKSSVNAIGPAVGWLMNGGEMLVEGKFLREFSARNRTEGQAFWLTVSKPL